MDDRPTVQDLLNDLERWRVRAARGTGKARVSLRDLAAASGVPRSSLANYLSGKTLMPADVLDAVVLALGAGDARGWATAWEQATADYRRPATADGPASRPSAPPAAADPVVMVAEGSDSPQASGSEGDPEGGPGGSPARPSPAQLPADLADFTGRRREVRRIVELLAPGEGPQQAACVVVTAVSGTGGVGKTALAVHVGHRLREVFPDGQIFVDLAATGDRQASAEDLVARLLRDLGVAADDMPAEAQERAALYRSLLADRSVLIILDNARNGAQVRPLLPGSGACRVLVTSRSRMADVAGCIPVELEVLDDTEALALFTTIVGTGRVAGELKASADVLSVCAGLPLAIRICGARLVNRPAWSIGYLARRLGDHSRRLNELSAGDLAIRSSLALSFDDLAARRAPDGGSLVRCLRLLAIAPTAETGAPAAAALFDMTPEQAEAALETLVDASLVQSPSAGRYRMHDLVRMYCAERSAEDDSAAERESAADRVLAWYARTAANAALVVNPRRRHPSLDMTSGGQPWDFGSYDDALAWLDLEYANLVAAANTPQSRAQCETAWKIPILLFDLFQLRAHHDEAVAAHEAALAAARRLGDHAAEGWLLSHLSVVHSNAGRPGESIDCLRAALDIDRSTGNRWSQTVNLVNLGFAYIVHRDFEQAVETLEEAALMAAETGHRVAEAAALANTGNAYMELGRLDEAATLTRRALAAHQALGDRQAEGATLGDMAEIEYRRGHARQAVDLCHAALLINRETGFRRQEAIALGSLGRALEMLGEVPSAQDALTEAHAIFIELGDPLAEEIQAHLDALA